MEPLMQIDIFLKKTTLPKTIERVKVTAYNFRAIHSDSCYTNEIIDYKRCD